MIRLPQKYSAAIGQRAEIYETEHKGHPAFLVIPCEGGDHGHIEATVSKPSLETFVKARLSASNQR